MFTGIIEEIGRVKEIRRMGTSLVMGIEAHVVLEGTSLGDSIAINGVCQTVTKLGKNFFYVDVMRESLTKTTLGEFKPGRRVNLERALTFGKPMGGHIVQGHVQGYGKLLSLKRLGKNIFLRLGLKKGLMVYMVKEGSITIDGLSLTISNLGSTWVEVNIIPHTLENTTIGDLKIGDRLNIEPDILVKATLDRGLTREKLISWGY